MKKITLVFLSLLLIAMPVFAFANDYSSMSKEELKTELDKIMLEISKQNTNTDKVLCDKEGFKVYITGDIEISTNLYDETKHPLIIPITVFNESDQNLILFMDKISFNGWEITTLFDMYELDAHKKLKTTIQIDTFLESTDITSVSEIKNIEAYYHITDSDIEYISKDYRTTIIINN